MKYLIKCIQSLKMKIEKFDEEYEKKQGYKARDSLCILLNNILIL